MTHEVDCHHRFWKPVRATDRPAGSRAQGLFADLPAAGHDGKAAKARTSRASFCRAGRPASMPKTRRPATRGSLSWACRCWASVTGCRSAARSWGREVAPAHSREYGRTELRISDADRLCSRACREHTTVWMSHGDQVNELTGDFLPLAATATLPVCGGQAQRRIVLRRAVSSGGDAYATRDRDSQEFPVRYLRVQGRLADERFCRADRRGGAQAGRRRPR